MFDVGMIEVIVIGGTGVLLLGKRDMPLVFRLVGRGVGKVSGLVQGGRARMDELSKGSDLLQLQNEIRSNLDDLRVIKAELRGAARLPAGVTGSSHPGSAALRDRYAVSSGPSSTSGQPGSLPGSAPASVASHPLDQTGYASQSHLEGYPRDTAVIRQPVGGLPSDASTTLRSRSHEPPSTAASGTTGEGMGAVRRADAGGVGDGVQGLGRHAGAGTQGGSQTSSQAVRSVVSPGEDRLQRLAMAEIGFAEKELFAPKTDSIPGGADILNEAITDSLLQARYQRVLNAARSSDGPSREEGTGSPSSSS